LSHGCEIDQILGDQKTKGTQGDQKVFPLEKLLKNKLIITKGTHLLDICNVAVKARNIVDNLASPGQPAAGERTCPSPLN